MAFQELNPIDISYKNKVFGNLVDPYEWNNNFITIENNVDSNVEKINTNFTTLNGEDGAKEIGMEDVLGGTEIPSNVYTQIMLLASRVVASYTKAEIDNILNTVAESTVANITLNEGTGQFTVTYADSTPEHPHTSVIDTDLEKVPASMALVESGNTIMLRITNLDGSYTEADVTRLIDVYTVADSDTIAMSINDRTITASIKNGSITSDKLALSVVTELQNYVTLAQTYATNAETSATASNASATDSANSAVESRSYAVGGTGTRQGEATDNAKYYSQQASSYADNANTYAGNSYASASQANTYANNASVFADTASNKAIEAANSATLAGTKVTDANAKALIAEGWAKGTQNGEEVGSDSPYYHDNAKYWSKQAEEHISGQAKITATGLLKGMGNGVVTSAVPDEDYQPPLDFTSTPSANNRVVTERDMSSGAVIVTTETTQGELQELYEAGKSMILDFIDEDEHEIFVPFLYQIDNVFYFGTVIPTSDNELGALMVQRGQDRWVDHMIDYTVPTDAQKIAWNAKQDALTFTSTPSASNRVVVENDLPKDTPEIVTFSNTFTEIKTLVEAGKNVILHDSGRNLCFFIKSITKSNDDNIVGVVFSRIDVISVTGGSQRITESKYTVNGTGWSSIEVLTYSCAAKDSPSLTGTPTAPTAAAGTNTTQIATTAFVQDAISGKQDALAIPSQHDKILKSDGHGGVMSAYDGEDYISAQYVTSYPNTTNQRILTKMSRGYEVEQVDARATLNFTDLLPNTIIDIVPVDGILENINVEVPSGDERFASEVILFFKAGASISINITLDFDQNPVVIWQGGTPVFTTGKLYEVHLLYLPNRYVIASYTEYDMPS